MKLKDNLERNTRTNSLLTLVSRFMGLLRDGAISRLFGTGPMSSAFYFAFLIPNLFRRLFGEGALAAAFLPSYTKLQMQDPQLAKAFATLTTSKLVTLLGLITIIAELLLWAIVSSQSEPSVSLKLTMVMLPYMPLVCLVAVFGAMLHVHDRFGPTAAAPIILNGFMIISAFGLVGLFDNPFNHMILIGISVVLAGVVQVTWSLLALRKFGWFTTDTKIASGELKIMMRRMLPMILGLGTLQINTLLDGLVANWTNLFGKSFFFGLQYPLGDGAMASITWAQRLYQFPLGVFGIAVATAIYPLLAKQTKNQASFTSTIQRGLRLVVYVGLPASAGLILVRDPLSAVIFQGANFTSEDAMKVGAILLGYAPAVWAYSMVHILNRGLYAKDDVMTAVRISMFCVVINFVLNVLLIWTPLKTSGLAWSTAICGVIQACILIFVINKHVKQPVNSEVVRSWLSTSLLTVVMSGFVAYLINQMWNPLDEWWDSLLTLSLSVLTGMIIMVAGSWFLKKPELLWVLGRNR
ncbi:MAG: murein biosynthesis integral membrane protein MurJ [Phycisphaerales bacterium]|jgi:putative peptidoglycan lipid II flippase|nr:murein biosynthesis integral membrane protein MurJ [Phycisphaerales bacterium]